MCVLGVFHGGAFEIQDRASGPPTTIAATHRWISFDGLHTHWSRPIKRGTRYSVIAFNFADRG